MSTMSPSCIRRAVVGALLCALTPWPAAQSQSAPLRLASGTHVLVLEATHGGIAQIMQGADTLSVGTSPDPWLWIAHHSPDRAGRTRPPITPAQAGRFTPTLLPGSKAAWRLVWEQFADAPDLRVVATVTMRAGDGSSEWTLAVEGLIATPLDSIRFPRVVGIPRLGARETLVVPLWMGQQMAEPRARFASVQAQGTESQHPLGATTARAQSWAYPGALAMQLMALYPEQGPGLRMSTSDSLAWRKSFTIAGADNGTLTLETAHLLPEPGSTEAFTLPYAVQVGAFRGDWVTVATWYRDWGMQQSWARNSRVARGVVAPWVDSTGVWVWNRGRSPAVLGPAKALQAYAGLPVSVFWHWWHRGPYDTSFPEYLPPREGAAPFTAAVREAQQAGLHAIVYMNQRLWCTATPSWLARDAQQGAVRERDGTIRTEVYNIFDPVPCATMSVTSPFWRQTYAGIADTVIHQYGIDGIYMDQAVLSLVNWRRGAGMPVGGGNYWMEGFTTLANDLRRMARERNIVLAGEGGGETWLPELDLFLTLQVSQERYADPANGWEPLPLFQAVYHEVANTYGTYGSLTYPPYDELWPDSTRPANALALLERRYAQQFRLEQARLFVWGMQPSIANFLPEQLTERRSEIDYLVRLATLRKQAWSALHRGQFLRPPPLAVAPVTVRLSRISIYAARRGGPTEAEKVVPSVLHGAWRAVNGAVVIPLASIADEETHATLTLDPSALGVPPQARVSWIDTDGTRDLGALSERGQLRVTLPRFGAALLLIESAVKPR